jgi:transposase
MGVAMTRLDLSASDLRQAAKGLEDPRQVRRVLALALVLKGTSRTAAWNACGMDRRTLRDWVHRYNAEGIDGLRDRVRAGRPSQMTPEQGAEFKAIVLAGRDPARDRVVRWRRIDPRRVIHERFNVLYHVRTIRKLLEKFDFRHLSVRPRASWGLPETAFG